MSSGSLSFLLLRFSVGSWCLIRRLISAFLFSTPSSSYFTWQLYCASISFVNHQFGRKQRRWIVRCLDTGTRGSGLGGEDTILWYYEKNGKALFIIFTRYILHRKLAAMEGNQDVNCHLLSVLIVTWLCPSIFILILSLSSSLIHSVSAILSLSLIGTRRSPCAYLSCRSPKSQTQSLHAPDPRQISKQVGREMRLVPAPPASLVSPVPFRPVPSGPVPLILTTRYSVLQGLVSIEIVGERASCVWEHVGAGPIHHPSPLRVGLLRVG